MTHAASPDATEPRSRGRVLGALAGIVAACVLVLTAAPAHAHDTLVDSDPADGSIIADAPTEAVLTFSADPTPTGAVALLRDPDGTETHLPDPAFDARDVIWELPVVEDGENTLVWSVISSDGHRIEGEITFVVAAIQPTDEAELDTDDATENGEEDTADPVETEEATADGTEPTEPTEEPAEEDGTDDSDEVSGADTEDDGSWLPGGRTATIVGVVALVLALGAGIWFLVQRRRTAADANPDDSAPLV